MTPDGRAPGSYGRELGALIRLGWPPYNELYGGDTVGRSQNDNREPFDQLRERVALCATLKTAPKEKWAQEIILKAGAPPAQIVPEGVHKPQDGAEVVTLPMDGAEVVSPSSSLSVALGAIRFEQDASPVAPTLGLTRIGLK